MNDESRIVARVSLDEKMEIEAYVEAHPELYKSVGDFIRKVAFREVREELERAHFKKMILKCLEDPEILVVFAKQIQQASMENPK